MSQAAARSSTPSAYRLVVRDIVTPVTIVTFVVSTVTGVMLLLHWNAGLVRFSHEWLSLGFSAVAIWHLVKNWRAFTGYLRRNLPLAAFGVATAASLLITGMTGTSSQASPGQVFGALSRASLEAAAPAFGVTPEVAIARLAAAGIQAAAPDTLAAIGNRAGRSGADIATLLAQVGQNP
ncbi:MULTISPECIES: DUF4405 domain-containing protein [Roseomonadaceae]|uniref:DUF4405 domain-containing protein n=1 Tax=Falsiroseomonas oleicola TaxID=2801474 RepID=A0ABS6H788_9PROT|nr:DUF4405 domain-containing protein [Roseomonas oleicola]MBU8544548.1 DUF4405 domain-containing protein [Roseomonas oleicola]